MATTFIASAIEGMGLRAVQRGLALLIGCGVLVTVLGGNAWAAQDITADEPPAHPTAEVTAADESDAGEADIVEAAEPTAEDEKIAEAALTVTTPGC
ncbi:MAG: hypothetical protein R3C10_15260 [Pirellulales bacterium]